MYASARVHRALADAGDAAVAAVGGRVFPDAIGGVADADDDGLVDGAVAEAAIHGPADVPGHAAKRVGVEEEVLPVVHVDDGIALGRVLVVRRRQVDDEVVRARQARRLPAVDGLEAAALVKEGRPDVERLPGRDREVRAPGPDLIVEEGLELDGRGGGKLEAPGVASGPRRVRARVPRQAGAIAADRDAVTPSSRVVDDDGRGRGPLPGVAIDRRGWDGGAGRQGEDTQRAEETFHDMWGRHGTDLSREIAPGTSGTRRLQAMRLSFRCRVRRSMPRSLAALAMTPPHVCSAALMVSRSSSSRL